MARVVRAPRGTELSCKGWGQEAAMRMLMNNLDPEVAGDPEKLIVYGGRRKNSMVGKNSSLVADHVPTQANLRRFRVDDRSRCFDVFSRLSVAGLLHKPSKPRDLLGLERIVDGTAQS